MTDIRQLGKTISANAFQCYIRRHIKLLGEFSSLSRSHYFQCVICSNLWQTNAVNIWNGRGCRMCSVNRKRTSIDDLHKLGTERGLRLLSDKCMGISTQHTWQCMSCSRTLHIKPSNVRRGTTCKCKKHANSN